MKTRSSCLFSFSSGLVSLPGPHLAPDREVLVGGNPSTDDNRHTGKGGEGRGPRPSSVAHSSKQARAGWRAGRVNPHFHLSAVSLCLAPGDSGWPACVRSSGPAVACAHQSLPQVLRALCAVAPTPTDRSSHPSRTRAPAALLRSSSFQSFVFASCWCAALPTAVARASPSLRRLLLTHDATIFRPRRLPC